MFVFLLLMLNVLLLFFTFSSFSDKKRIFVPLAEAISVFLCLYTLISALMWVFEVFTVEFCLLSVTILVVSVFSLTYFIGNKKRVEFFSFGEIKLDHSIIINKIIILTATFISLGAYSTIGIGYNDGNVRFQALSILNGENKIHFEIDEYEKINPGSAYEFYFYDAINEIDKEEFTANYRISHIDTEEGKTERMIGEYGSNPVYPSILALSGSLFGTQRMAYIQAFFAFCLFVFVDEILRALKCDWKLRSVLVLLLGVTPILVYCNHTTLVEPLIGFCMVMFMYFLICRKNKLQMLSALGVITFAFLHTSVYTMLPLFLIMYWMFFVRTGKVRHLISSGIMVAGYALSFAFLNITAYDNTSINYRLGIPFLGNYYYIFVIIIVAITIMVGMFLALFVKKTDSNKLAEFNKNKGCRIFKILIAVASAVSIPMTAVIIIRKCYSYQDFLNITFIAFIVCSGVIIIPYVLFKLISTKYQVGIREAIIIVSFVYTVVLYSCVMKTMLDGYYYGSRYISSFMPIVIIIAGIMLRLLKKEEKYFIPVIGIIILLMPYTSLLLNSKTETRLNYNLYEDVMETVKEQSDENTVVLVEKSLLKYFYYPLIHTTDAQVYPIEPGLFETFCRDTNNYKSKAIYITDDIGNEFVSKGNLYYLNYNIQNIATKVDSSSILGLPSEFHDRLSRKVQIVEIDSLYELLNKDTFKEMEMENLDLSVKKVEITDEGLAHIIVSLTDGSEIYRNDKLFLSYHLEYDNAEDEYECPRILFGPLTVDDYLIDVDLTDQPEDVTVVIDVVEDGVAWYSYENKVPIIMFIETDEGWDYKIYKFFTKLK